MRGVLSRSDTHHAYYPAQLEMMSETGQPKRSRWNLQLDDAKPFAGFKCVILIRCAGIQPKNDSPELWKIGRRSSGGARFEGCMA